VKQRLTTARDTLSAVTQLPAAAQLTGETRTQMQQLINNFNELITTGADWRVPYAKIESGLAALLGPVAPPSGTAGAVGTSGTGRPMDPAIRDMLVEFRNDLKEFERVASGNASPEPTPTPAPEPAPTPAPAPAAAPAPPPQLTPDPPPARSAPPAPERDERPASPIPSEDEQDTTATPRNVLLHVEAIEVILGAQTAAQKASTAAAGGAVVSSETPSGSTRTTISGPNVTLTPEQLDEITTHLKAIRQLLDKK
jgi:outer membrane biosynthesis protein TonB